MTPSGVPPLLPEEELVDAPAPTPPPRAGAGSGLVAWQRYAAAVGVVVSSGASRDQVIAACERAGAL